ncbi:hypothetical protein Pcar_3276 [Syntrophotalea carbinolica DSM 2380]|uniref:Uncharacterized protein n=1 Tax=Syntrophotalea carbinolica (strain DSM 2380 / NBRC 103641 / GraBd1) TaxID=338963 RepID=Q0C6P1_SYNC1|nr:hypothetical protein Pcar_3276 [Syntrophotalea carbinolica DSM 2380]
MKVVLGVDVTRVRFHEDTVKAWRIGGMLTAGFPLMKKIAACSFGSESLSGE